VVYEHRDLVDEFKARVKAQNTVPAAVEKVAEHNRVLQGEITRLKADLIVECEKNKTLARVAVELSLELEQAKEEIAQGSSVVRLPSNRSGSIPYRES